MVAGDFNGASWRRKCGEDQRRASTIEEVFANTDLPIPDGPTPLWGPGGVLGEWADVCGFLKPPGTDKMARLKSITKFWVSGLPIKAEIMKFGFTSSTLTRCCPRLSAPTALFRTSTTVHHTQGKGPTFTTTCDHSLRDHSHRTCGNSQRESYSLSKVIVE